MKTTVAADDGCWIRSERQGDVRYNVFKEEKLEEMRSALKLVQGYFRSIPDAASGPMSANLRCISAKVDAALLRPCCAEGAVKRNSEVPDHPECLRLISHGRENFHTFEVAFRVEGEIPKRELFVTFRTHTCTFKFPGLKFTNWQDTTEGFFEEQYFE